jgi:pilus biogenesis lipoprotein CpaD
MARAFLVVGATVLASGCGTQEQYWSSSAAPKENRVDWVTHDHKVGFQASGVALSGAERARFDRFLRDLGVGYGDQVAIGIEGATGTDAQTADRRVESVREYLRGRSIQSVVAPAERKGTWDGSVMVTVGRYVVTPPPCPNWEKPPGYDWANTEASNLGCATVTNLGLMLADPGALVRGREVGAGDGTVQAHGVEQWRTGKGAKAAASVSGTAAPGSSKGAAGSEASSEGGD